MVSFPTLASPEPEGPGLAGALEQVGLASSGPSQAILGPLPGHPWKCLFPVYQEPWFPRYMEPSFLLVVPCPPADTPHTQGPRRLLAQFSQPWQQLSWVMPRWGFSFSGSQVTRPGSDRQKVRALPRTSGIPSRTRSSVLPCPSPYPSSGYRGGGQPCLL